MVSKERRRDIRRRADEFRNGCTIRRYGIRDLFEECRKRGYKVFRWPLGKSGKVGFSMRKENDIILFTNSSYCLSDEIFTLAHEIGHVLLHFDDQESFVDNERTTSYISMDDREQEANYFAQCLLMPKNEVEKFFELEIIDTTEGKLAAMDIARLMAEFKVGFKMLLEQLETYHIINKDEREALTTDKNKARVSNLLNATGGDRKLTVVSGERAMPYEYLEYVIYNYNKKAVPKETLVRALDYYCISYDDVSDKFIEPERFNWIASIKPKK